MITLLYFLHDYSLRNLLIRIDLIKCFKYISSSIQYVLTLPGVLIIDRLSSVLFGGFVSRRHQRVDKEKIHYAGDDYPDCEQHLHDRLKFGVSNFRNSFFNYSCHKIVRKKTMYGICSLIFESSHFGFNICRPILKA